MDSHAHTQNQLLHILWVLSYLVVSPIDSIGGTHYYYYIPVSSSVGLVS